MNACVNRTIPNEKLPNQSGNPQWMISSTVNPEREIRLRYKINLVVLSRS